MIGQSLAEQALGWSDDLTIASYWVNVNGAEVHYKGMGQGPAVIFVHGIANDWHEWRKNLSFFADNFRVYAPDLPGFGLSGPAHGPISPAWFSSFLKDFMDALDIDKASLVAHSLGGSIALTFAMAYPERLDKLVLIDSTGFGRVSLGGRWLLHFIRAFKRMIGIEKSPRYRRVSVEDWLFIDGLEEIRAPVLIVWGKGDPYLPLSQAIVAQSVLPDAELYVFSACRHAPQRKHAEEFNRLVSGFLGVDVPAHRGALAK